MVEHIGFRKYSKGLQPSFTMISRKTLRKDILKVFDFEKGKTMKMLASVQSKIAITADMWTAQNQKCGFSYNGSLDWWLMEVAKSNFEV